MQANTLTTLEQGKLANLDFKSLYIKLSDLSANIAQYNRSSGANRLLGIIFVVAYLLVLVIKVSLDMHFFRCRHNYVLLRMSTTNISEDK